ANELGVRNMQGEHRLAICRSIFQVAAREDGKREAVLREQVLQHASTRAVALECRGAELDRLEAHRRDVGDRLVVLPDPGDGGVTQTDPSGGTDRETTRGAHTESTEGEQKLASTVIRHCNAP